MEEIVVIRGPNNSFHPATESDAEKVAKYKIGQGVTLRSTKVSDHNLLFHRKLILLYKLCYGYFVERGTGGIEYRGQLVKPSFDNFREELTIMAGHYEVHYSMGKMGYRVHGKSIAYSNMTDDEKERLYSDLINAALKHVYQDDMPEAELRGAVDRILAFDR